MSIRVMQAFELQANYQRHKKKISSIGSLNAKKKVINTTYKNI